MQFAPVPTRNQSAGWAAWRQQNLIETLAASGSVLKSADAVMPLPRSANLLRGRKGAESLPRAWDPAPNQPAGARSIGYSAVAGRASPNRRGTIIGTRSSCCIRRN